MSQETPALRSKAVRLRHIVFGLVGLVGTGAIIFGLTLVGVFASEPPNTIIVSKAGDEHYTTIAEAVSKAPAGARIAVRPGVYQDGLIIDKPAEIVGWIDDESFGGFL